jgi:hypothetical protein
MDEMPENRRRRNVNGDFFRDQPRRQAFHSRVSNAEGTHCSAIEQSTEEGGHSLSGAARGEETNSIIGA